MDIRFQPTPEKALHEKAWSAACTLVFAFEEEAPEHAAPALWQRAPWLAITPGLRDFSGKKDQTLLVYGHPEMPLSRVMLVGLGKREKAKAQPFRLAVAACAQKCRSMRFESLGIAGENLDYLGAALSLSREEVAAEVTLSALLGLYRYKGIDGATPKGAEDDLAPDPIYLAFMLSDQHVPDPFRLAVRNAEAEAAGTLLARNLVNGPANIITPAVLAETAAKIARCHNFSFSVIGPKEIRDLGMGAFWAVASGAEQEPRLITLEFAPKGKENDQPLVFVGKGITFDTGGISLKPAAKMHEMKGDMAGAAAVIGLFEALGTMPEPETMPRIIGLIAATENMPGRMATRPGDVVTTLSGKTVEILNTDAEGRLVLCDALSYAQQQWKPKHLINIATLTGACVIALGDHATGLFTDSATLRSLILATAEKHGDLFWPLPMFDEYESNLKSDVADFTNMGPREGGALNAALFLRRFIEKNTDWAHLDIAGPGYVTKTSSLLSVSGGTGVGVRLFCEMARKLA